MRLAALFATLTLLAGCGAPVESEHPLFRPGHDAFKPGLWAMVPTDRPCIVPKNTMLLRWPECAAPVLIERNTATYFRPGPTHVAFVMADGNPRILQMNKDVVFGLFGADSNEANNHPDRRFYLAFDPDTPSPFTAGRLKFLFCGPRASDESPIEGLHFVGKDDSDQKCIADRASAIVTLAHRKSKNDGRVRLVWIASYP